MRRAMRILRESLAPAIDPHAASFLGRRVFGMRGPAWSLVALILVVDAYLVLGLTASAVSGTPVGPGRWLFVVGWVAFAVILVLLRDRTPGWLLHIASDLMVLSVGFVSLTATTELRSAMILMFLAPIAVYQATWFPRAQLGVHMLLIVLVAFVVAVTHSGDPGWLSVWLVIVGISVGIAYFVHALVTHLSRQVTIDPVTGLSNRTGLNAMAEQFQRRGENGLPRTVVLLDLDNFKAVNDRRGHDAGDEVRRQVGDALREHLRPTDIMTRLGGDEFVLLLSRLSVAQAEPIVRRLSELLPIEASFGLADWPLESRFEESLKVADAAMYDQKRGKRRG